MATVEREIADQQRSAAEKVHEAAARAAAIAEQSPNGSAVEGDFERSCRLKGLELASRQFKGRSSYAVVYAAATYAQYLETGTLPTEKIGDTGLPKGMM